MPIYEYRCPTCKRKVSIFWRSLSAVNDADAACSYCGGKQLVRLVSKVRVIRGGAQTAADDVADDPLAQEMDGLDENDPRALGRFMRKMAAETGEDMPPEFDEVVGRLEKGENPEAIEQSMGDLFGEEGGMGGMMDDEYGAPTPDPAKEADAKAEADDRKKVGKKRTVTMKGRATPKPKRRAGSKPKRRK